MVPAIILCTFISVAAPEQVASSLQNVLYFKK